MNELERILNLAGVSYEAPEKIEETTEEIAEEQSQAQKDAFAKMLASKKGAKKDDKVEETEELEEDEDLLRLRELAGSPNPANEFESTEEIANDDELLEREYQAGRTRKKNMGSDLDEAPNEGNEFSGNRKAAIDAGEDEFEVDGKKYKVSGNKNEAIEEAEDPDYSKDNLDICDKCDEEVKDCKCDDEIEESLEVVEESPTMDTTQLITLLKNSGISEDQIASRLKVIEEEFGNTPEGVGETEPTVHGSDDNYNFAQAVNLSLKRYLDAADMKVQVSEHTKENLTAKYLASKK